jgi:hypothetical protein
MTFASTSPTVPVVAKTIPMPPERAVLTMDTPPHLPKPAADLQGQNSSLVDQYMPPRPNGKKERSLAKSVSIDGQKYRTAAEVDRCRHTILTKKALVLDVAFPLHHTATFKELLHDLRAWTSSRSTSKKTPGDHVDGGWSVVIHHTEKPAKTKGGRRRLHCDWHHEARTKDTNAGAVMDAISLSLISLVTHTLTFQHALCVHTQGR